MRDPLIWESVSHSLKGQEQTSAGIPMHLLRGAVRRFWYPCGPILVQRFRVPHNLHLTESRTVSSHTSPQSLTVLPSALGPEPFLVVEVHPGGGLNNLEGPHNSEREVAAAGQISCGWSSCLSTESRRRDSIVKMVQACV